MKSLLARAYGKRKVLVTGHTGFKGSWLAFWLSRLGAKVTGYSLEPPTRPNHFELLELDCASVLADLRDQTRLRETIEAQRPEIVFHLAAQAIVRKSYSDPAETFSSNVTGLVNLLEACRKSESVTALVVVTSDKCYDNRGLRRGYREQDAMGGYDPYSASKGCAEIIASSYRRSFFPPEAYGRSHRLLLASARAGNVLGGGDWGQDRLVPDVVKAAATGDRALIRYPRSIRPWQHVLDPLSGYLLLGARLLEGHAQLAGAWNFGPSATGAVSVAKILKMLSKGWDKIDWRFDEGGHPHEAAVLRLDCEKARSQLGWRPVWDIGKTIWATAAWYRGFYEEQKILTAGQIEEYQKDAEAAEVGGRR